MPTRIHLTSGATQIVSESPEEIARQLALARQSEYAQLTTTETQHPIWISQRHVVAFEEVPESGAGP